MELILYHMPRTRSVRPLWLMEELGLTEGNGYSLKIVDLFSGDGSTQEHKKLHPFGQIPVLVVDGKPLFESGAICQWLADSFMDKGLAPELNNPLRAEYEQWMYFVLGTLEPPIWQLTLHSKILPAEMQVKEIAKYNFRQCVYVSKTFAPLMEGKEFMVGDTFSAADIMVGTTLFWMEEFIKKFPHLVDYVERLKSRDAFQCALSK